MAHLTLMVQGREVRRFVLNPTTTTIGRAQDNDIVINNLALSRRHAEVHFRHGRYQVEDVGSQNGVFINSERIRGARPLDPEDMITLGTYQFVFSDESSRDPDINGARDRRKKEITEREHVESVSQKPVSAKSAESTSDAQPLLVLKYNDVELQRFVLREAPCLIGRGKDCEIQIAERRLSRRHCQVRTEGGRVILEDLDSQNGTFVNRRRIPSRRELEHGDILNFAEYSILYLANAEDYDGPDRDDLRSAPLADSAIQREETDFSDSLESSPAPASVPVVRGVEAQKNGRTPLIAPSRRDGPDGEPFVERPDRNRERRTPHVMPAEAPSVRPTRTKGRGRPDRAAPQRGQRDGDLGVDVRPVRVDPVHVRPARGEQSDEPVRSEVAEHRDVEDHRAEVRPDRRLDDWYDRRGDSDVYHEEPSVLLERSKSSMSQLLRTMMVDKRELDRNLAVQAKERRFMIEVSAQGRTSYAGPLKQAVTILGRDEEADIKLTGRYVAGRHSLLVRVLDSLLLVRLGSSSAARVNGLPKLQAFLKSGDVIQIDETTIRILEE